MNRFPSKTSPPASQVAFGGPSKATQEGEIFHFKTPFSPSRLWRPREGDLEELVLLRVSSIPFQVSSLPSPVGEAWALGAWGPEEIPRGVYDPPSHAALGNIEDFGFRVGSQLRRQCVPQGGRSRRCLSDGAGPPGSLAGISPVGDRPCKPRPAVPGPRALAAGGPRTWSLSQSLPTSALGPGAP